MLYRPLNFVGLFCALSVLPSCGSNPEGAAVASTAPVAAKPLQSGTIYVEAGTVLPPVPLLLDVMTGSQSAEVRIHLNGDARFADNSDESVQVVSRDSKLELPAVRGGELSHETGMADPAEPPVPSSSAINARSAPEAQPEHGQGVGREARRDLASAPSLSTTAESPETISPGCNNHGISTRPLAYNEHWVDPANPASGEHVVLFFRVPDSISPNCLIRKWQGYERDWLDRYMLWAQPIGAGDQRIMLFIYGWWWWPRRPLYSAATIASEFEIIW